jgi:hypothetical protein
MYTVTTFEILNEAADPFISLTSNLPIENVHLRGAMFGFYKKGSNVQKVNGRWPDKGLQLMKPGKLFRMLEGNDEYSDKNVEHFVNKIKSYVSMNGDEHGEGAESPNFSVVSGEMIGYYYLNSNYADFGTSSNLMGSCMRYDTCQPYFRFYEQNQDSISMLILRNNDYKIVARALLWFDGENMYMDTVYHATDAHCTTMIEYAKRHGFYYKSQQSCHFFAFDMYNGSKISPEIVKIPVHIDESWSSMPWLDTVMYIVKDGDKFYATNCLSEREQGLRCYQFRSTSGPSFNSDFFSIDNETKLLRSEVSFALLYNGRRRGVIDEMIKTYNESLATEHARSWRSGIFYDIILNPNHEEKSVRVFFDNEEEEEEEDDDENRDGQVWSEWEGEWLDEEDAVYCDSYSDYISWANSVEIRGSYYHQNDEDITYVESRDRYYHVESTTYCEYTQNTIHIDDAIYVEEYGYVHEDDIDEVAVEVDGCYYKIDKCVQCEISGEWMLIKEAQELPDGRKVTQDEYDKFMAENESEEEEQP